MVFAAQSLSQFLPRPEYPGYSFKFNIEDKGSHAREEESSFEGHVTGKYSYVDPNGNLRVIRYNSTPENGFVAYGDTGVPLLKSNIIGVSGIKPSSTTITEEAHTEVKFIKEPEENIPFQNTFSDKKNTHHVLTTEVLHFPKSNNLITLLPQANFNGKISKTESFDGEARLSNKHYFEDVDKVAHHNSGLISSQNNDIKTFNVKPFSASSTEIRRDKKIPKEPEENIPFENTFSDKENTLHVPTSEVLHFPRSNNLIIHLPQRNFAGLISKTELLDNETRLLNRHYFEDADKVAHENNGVISSKNNDIKTFNANPFSTESIEIRAAETSIKEPGYVIPFRDVQASAAGDDFNVLGSPSIKMYYFPDSNSLTSLVSVNNRQPKTQLTNSQPKFSNMHYSADADKIAKDKKLSGKTISLLMKENEIIKNNTELDKKIQDFLKVSSNSAIQQHQLSLPINFFPYFIYPTPHFITVYRRPYIL